MTEKYTAAFSQITINFITEAITLNIIGTISKNSADNL